MPRASLAVMPETTNAVSLIPHPNPKLPMLISRPNRLFAIGLILALFVCSQDSAHAKLFINDKKMDYTSDKEYMTYLRWLLVPPEKQNGPIFTGNDMNDIRAKLEDPLRREIFDRMSESKEQFNFATLDEAKQLWQIRVLTVSYIKRVKGNGEMPEIPLVYYNPKTLTPKVDSPLWERIPKTPYLKVTKDAKAYEAINDFLLNGKKAEVECACTSFACGYAAAATVIGEEAFNKLHPPGTFSISPAVANKHYYSANKDGLSTHVPGDRLYMINSDYDKRATENKLKGPWRGENAIYIGGGKYSGLGVGQVTEAELRAKLKATYKELFGEDPANPEQTIVWGPIVARPKVPTVPK